MNNKKSFLRKSIVFFIFEIFLISLFILLSVSIADARAGGGHSFRSSGGSRSFSRSSSRSYSGSSYRHSSYRGSGEDASFGEILIAIIGFFIVMIPHYIFSLLLAKIRDENDENIWSTAADIAFDNLKWVLLSWLAIPFLVLKLLLLKNKPKPQLEDFKFKEVNNFSAIKTKDTQFTSAYFLERAKKAFLIVQEAWSNRDLSKAEAFLADGTYEQFQIQINAMKARHEIDVMKDINILKAGIVRTESKSGYDSIFVLFRVRAVNYRIDDVYNTFKDGSKSPEEFSEIWTFMRRTGSKTIKNGLIEGFCPNCGTSVQGSRLSKCPSCSSLLKSGEHDWIITGITQASEWRNSHAVEPVAYRTMLDLDNKLNIQHLEDKISLVFWRMVESNRLGNSGPISKISTDDFARLYTNSPRYEEAFPKCNNCAIGSVEIKGFVTNRPEYDYLYAQVVWSGTIISENLDITRKTLFVLRRKKGVISDPGKCFCSSHCPNCGAPESEDVTGNECSYCNSVMNDDAKDWMLSDILKDFSEKEATEYMKDARMSAQMQNNNIQTDSSSEAKGSFGFNYFDYVSGNDLLSIAIAMMLADGVIDDREMKIINDIKKARNISDDVFEKVLNKLKAIPNPVNYVLATTSIRMDENLLKLLITIAASDGKIDDTEIDFLNKIAKRINYPSNKLRDMINSVYENKWENH